MTEEDKIEFYNSEFRGAPLSQHLTFRCTKRLETYLKNKSLEEKKEYSSIIRRLVIWAAEQEGFDKNAI